MARDLFKDERSKNNLKTLKYTKISKSISWFFEKEKLDIALANSLIFEKENIKFEIRKHKYK